MINIIKKQSDINIELPFFVLKNTCYLKVIIMVGFVQIISFYHL